MRKAKAIYSELFCSKGVSHHHLHLGRDPKAGRGTGKLYSEKKRKLERCPVWGLLAWEAVGEPTRSGVSYVIRVHLASSGWS